MYWSFSTKSVYIVHKKSIEEILLYILSMERGFCEGLDIRDWWNMQIDAANFCQSSLDEINIEIDHKSFHTPPLNTITVNYSRQHLSLMTMDWFEKGWNVFLIPSQNYFNNELLKKAFKNPNRIFWFDFYRQRALRCLYSQWSCFKKKKLKIIKSLHPLPPLKKQSQR